MNIEELSQEIIYRSINSAVCIDDSFIPPYEQGQAENDNFVRPKELYLSFRKDGKCDLDIYKYNGIEAFHNDKSYLFNNKDLLILDWELQPNQLIKYKDSISISILC